MCHTCRQQWEQEETWRKMMGTCSYCEYPAMVSMIIKKGKKIRFCDLHHYKHNLEIEPSSKYAKGWMEKISKLVLKREKELQFLYD